MARPRRWKAPYGLLCNSASSLLSLLSPLAGHLIWKVDFRDSSQRMDPGSCPTVSLEVYWNSIATPMFFLILVFGIYVLFSLSPFQLAPGQTLQSKLAELKTRPMFAGSGPD